MLGFVQNIFAPASHPIGIDIGTDSLRFAQVQMEGDDFKLVAAASAEIPADARGDADALLEFFAESGRNLLSRAEFRGRRAVLGLPPSAVHTHQLSLEEMDGKLLEEAIIRESKERLPFDPSEALLRHVVAGKTTGTGDPRLQVVVMAADTKWVTRLLAAARSARLDIIGIKVQPMALLDCFANVYRRKSEQQSVRLYVDFGNSGTRAYIARGTHLLFARNLPIGGDHLTRAVAEGMEISNQDARTLRIKLGAGSEDPDSLADSDRNEKVAAICRQASGELVNGLDSCRREHESVFPNLPVQRVIFVGGEARLENLCQHIAERLELPGQTGDSLCRMARNSRIGIESAIDRRHPQPAWAAAVGLSMGPSNEGE